MMIKLKKLIMLILLATIVALESCKCYGGDERGRLEQIYTIQFRLFDKNTRQNLIVIGGRYNKDSVQVYRADDSLIYPGPVPGNGAVSFRPYFNTGLIIPLEKDTTEYYYLYLRDQGLDVDTLRVDYRAVINDCSEKEFTKLNLYYNEELIAENDRPTDGYYVELYK